MISPRRAVSGARQLVAASATGPAATWRAAPGGRDSASISCVVSAAAGRASDDMTPAIRDIDGQPASGCGRRTARKNVHQCGCPITISGAPPLRRSTMVSTSNP